MSYLVKDFGTKIKAYRELKNLSQEALAEKLDVTSKTISQWENNKSTPKYSSLIMLCKFLEIPENDLLFRQEENNNSFIGKIVEIASQISPTRHKQVLEILKTFVE